MFSAEDRYNLEHIFANNFQSSAFPILADLYYNNKEYKRAKKVCQIGLQHNPKSILGQFVLSKLYWAQ